MDNLPRWWLIQKIHWFFERIGKELAILYLKAGQNEGGEKITNLNSFLAELQKLMSTMYHYVGAW